MNGLENFTNDMLVGLVKSQSRLETLLDYGFLHFKVKNSHCLTLDSLCVFHLHL